MTQGARRRWPVLAGVILVAHLLGSLLWPTSGWVTGASVASSCLLAALVCLGSGGADALMRRRYWLLAAAFLLWSAAYGAIALLQSVVHADSSRALFDSFLFMARGAPLFLLLATGLDGRSDKPVRAIDLAQTVLMLALVSNLLFRHSLLGGSGQAVSDMSALAIRDMQNVALAALALFAALVQDGRRNGKFFSSVALLLVSYAATALFVNRVIIAGIGPPPSSPLFLLVHMPILLFLWSERIGQGRLSIGFIHRRHLLLVRLIAPAALTMASLCLALTLVGRGDASGFVGGMAALFLYALRTVAIQLAIQREATDLRIAHDRAERLSTRDPLTGLANRRLFAPTLRAAFAHARDQGMPVSVLMIDVDWFKRLNDQMGHATGDDYLRHIGDILTRNVRQTDLVARIGGEEFAVLAPDTGQAVAMLLGERLRAAIEDRQLTHGGSPFAVSTVSIGVASSDMDLAFDDAEDMVKAADKALYVAKAAGRNQVSGQAESTG